MNKPSRSIFTALSSWLTYLIALSATLIFCSLLLSYFVAGEIYHYKDTVQFNQTHLPPVDAIVVLGGGKGRITTGGDLWLRYKEQALRADATEKKVPVLYLSGMGRQARWTFLSKQLRREVQQTIQPQDILLERESFNTDTNARWLIKYATERHWKRILLLTSSYHMKRASYIFRQVMNTVQPPLELETYSIAQEPFTAEDWRNDPYAIRVTLIEYFKWIYYNNVWRSP